MTQWQIPREIIRAYDGDVYEARTRYSMAIQEAQENHVHVLEIAERKLAEMASRSVICGLLDLRVGQLRRGAVLESIQQRHGEGL